MNFLSGPARCSLARSSQPGPAWAGPTRPRPARRGRAPRRLPQGCFPLGAAERSLRIRWRGSAILSAKKSRIGKTHHRRCKLFGCHRSYISHTTPPPHTTRHEHVPQQLVSTRLQNVYHISHTRCHTLHATYALWGREKKRSALDAGGVESCLASRFFWNWNCVFWGESGARGFSLESQGFFLESAVFF